MSDGTKNKNIIKFINDILLEFQPCFARLATFNWFVVVVVGLMVRSDQLGTTSFIRDLYLDPKLYETMIHFFRSSAWSLENIWAMWFRVVRTVAPIYKEGDSVVLIGDGIKIPKEGRFMPGVDKQRQESENSSKAPYIFGNIFGTVGVLIGSPDKWFCLPLFLMLHGTSIKHIFSWKKKKDRQESHVVLMIKQGFKATMTFGNSILLLDRYYLSIPALKCLKELNQTGKGFMQIVTRAKMSIAAYKQPPAYSGKGRPPKKGEKVKLKELFITKTKKFKEATVLIYGKEEEIKYYCLNLLWGQGLYQELRFVLVEHNGKRLILVLIVSGVFGILPSDLALFRSSPLATVTRFCVLQPDKRVHACSVKVSLDLSVICTSRKSLYVLGV